ncbi:MAG TPA: HD domain-containing protein [Chloroflexi bacterium]|nr:HD domain-containing protein [Chloroflexota bacterium]
MTVSRPPASAPLILLVDDDAELTHILEEFLSQQGFRTLSAHTIKAALAVLRHETPTLLIADMRLPDGSGNDLIAYLRQQPEGEAVPVIVVSALADASSVQTARRFGADEYLIKPFHPDELLAVVQNSLHRRRAVEQLVTREAHLQTVTILAKTIEARDAYTGGHVERVSTYARKLAEALGWSAEDLMLLEFGALLHDIGKITIPENILNKPGPLTPEERAIMREHPQRGAEILRHVSHLRPTIPYILYHHERWDGKGYPEGLRGEAIPPEGRLLAIVDAYDAMTTRRPYRTHPLGKAEAAAEILRQSGTIFDPQMAKTFVHLVQEGKI